MSSTTSLAPSASSSSRVIQVEIPATTVLSIGLGFVGLVFTLLLVSLGTRLYRVRRRMLALRARGQPTNFPEMWQREGGVFGFFTTMGSNALTVGAGGAAIQRGREILWGGVPEKETPVIWDVPIREKADGLDEVDGLCEPFGLSSTVSPRYIDRATPANELPRPRFTLSLLISLPRDPSTPAKSQNSEEEDWPELPEVVIGTAQVCPMVYPKKMDGEGQSEAVVKDVQSGRQGGEKDGLASKKAEIQHLDYVPDEGRPARWERYDVVRWRIEGMR